MKINKEKYYIIRTFSAGVWYGKIKSLKGTEVVLLNARRLWRWSGAATLSELAKYGTTKPLECKFCVTINDKEGVYLPQVIEVLPVSKEAKINIDGVSEWKMKK